MFTRTLPLLAAVLAAAPALAKDDANARTQALIDAFKSVRSAPEGGTLTPEDRASNGAAFKALDAFFDWEKLLALPVEPHKARFSPEQLAKYQKVFRETLRLIAYPDSGKFFHDAKWSLRPAKVDGARADVPLHARLEAEDVETDVLFHWVDAGDAWRLVDVSFDGASLAHDYQNQFGRLIKKDGVDGLLKKLLDKYAEESKARGALE